MGLYDEFSYQWTESLKGGGMVWNGFVRRGVKSFFGAKKEYRKTNLKGAVNLWIEGWKAVYKVGGGGGL
jgi:hypothetical protein